MSILDNIIQKLNAALSPQHLNVVDSSPTYYGSDGASVGNISHISIHVVSDIFEGKSRVNRQRLVYNAISDEISKIHAITELTTLTSSEKQNGVKHN